MFVLIFILLLKIILLVFIWNEFQVFSLSFFAASIFKFLISLCFLFASNDFKEMQTRRGRKLQEQHPTSKIR